MRIPEWGIEDFLFPFVWKACPAPLIAANLIFYTGSLRFSEDWHQGFYAWLYSERDAVDRRLKETIFPDLLKRVKLVRRSDGGYGAGRECYWPTDGLEHDERFPRVAKGVYSSGQNKKQQQDDARMFLEQIGVHEVGDADRVESILKQRYASKTVAANDKEYATDLERFVACWRKSPRRSLFANCYFFKCVDGTWGRPCEVYLDAPIRDTGLNAYYEAVGKDGTKKQLSHANEHTGIAAEDLAAFAELVGVQTRLEPQWVACNPTPSGRTCRVLLARDGGTGRIQTT